LTARAAPALAALLLAAGAARADVTVDAGFGFDGAAVSGYATPVGVTLSSTEKAPITVRLELAASSGGPVAVAGLVQETEVFLAPGARKRVSLPVVSRGSGFGDSWVLTVRTDRRTLLRSGVRYADDRVFTIPLAAGAATPSPGTRVDPGTPVLGVLGDPGNRLGWLGVVAEEEMQAKAADRVSSRGLVLRSPGSRCAFVPSVVPISAASACDTWIGYEGFDAILWVDPDPSALPDQARLDALLEWALHGGRLLVALTPGARIPAGSALARALPVESLGHDDLDARVVLSALAGSSEGVRPGRLPVARCGAPRGTVVKGLPDGRPLIVSGSHGLGTVVSLAFDPRLLAGADAAPRGALLRLLLGAAGDAGTGGEEGWAGGSLDRLTSHLRQRFVRTPPLGLLILGLALYVLAIGPVDYLVLKRRNRLRRTVVTFPLIVVGFTVAAYAASFLLFGAAGGQARVAVLDFATSPARDADVVRGLDLLGTYSPVGRTLEVPVEAPRGFVAGPWLSPHGAAYDEGGEIEGRVVHAPDGRPTAFVDVPLRAFRAVQTRFSGEVAASLEAGFTDREDRTRLRVVNRTRRPVRDLCYVGPLEGGVHRTRKLGDLEPGGAIEVDVGKAESFPLTDPFQDAQGLFAGSGVLGDDPFVPRDSTEEAEASARTAVARALLGASVGGLRADGESRTTRLLARHGLDLTRAVREGRPLVMGWCDGDPIGGMLLDGGSVRSTVVVVRRLLPAKEAR